MNEVVRLEPWMIPASGYYCNGPVTYEWENEQFARNCGHCKRCVARKKRDVAGRAAAEAATSAEIVVWTLTYRPGEAGALEFVTPDRQRFLKRVRQHLYRQQAREMGYPKRLPPYAAHLGPYIRSLAPRVRLIGCGERGKRSTKRCHWHICLFMSKASGFRSTPRLPDGKPGHELHPLWPHGIVNIHVMGQDGLDDKMKAVRYAVKYLDKSRVPNTLANKANKVQPEAKFFRSQGRYLGYEFLEEEARRHARHGIPIRGDYRVPGVRFSRGKQEHIRHTVTGTAREGYIQAFVDEWMKTRPEVPIPMTDFMIRHWEGAIDKCLTEANGEPADMARRKRMRPTGWQPRAPKIEFPPIPKMPEREIKDCSGTIFVGSGGALGTVHMYRSGFCRFQDKQGKYHKMPHPNVRDFVTMTEAEHAEVERKIAEKRGKGWMGPEEMKVFKAKVQLAQRARYLAAEAAFEKLAPLAPAIGAGRWNGSNGPITGLHRKLRMNGNGHMPGSRVWADEKHTKVAIREETPPSMVKAPVTDGAERKGLVPRWQATRP